MEILKYEKNKIFISFSKYYAENVAKHLKLLIERVFTQKSVDVFVSSENMRIGDFRERIFKEIDATDFAIIVSTPENDVASSPWLMFESGLLLKKLGIIRSYKCL